MGANLRRASPVNAMQLSPITQCIWSLCTVACWDLIAGVVTHRGPGLIFSSVHRLSTSYTICPDYNYRLYLCLIRWHGTTGGWWALTVGCWGNYAVWGTWLLACIKEIVKSFEVVLRWPWRPNHSSIAGHFRKHLDPVYTRTLVGKGEKIF